jgi:hypothetical protein
MKQVDKDKVWKKKFKNILNSKILNARWEKEGLEVRIILIIHIDNI